MSEQYRIYLAVPGTSFCWGTTTGVINSSAKHIVRPFNEGVGFSGAEDFNLCWIDALNLYESGEVTHFAMLHGDIETDLHQRWLDVLLEEMDAKDAVLVSAHVPIKDMAGLCSCGVGDPSNPWAAFRRFTQREILNDLPPTFNAEMAGYPDRPLLANTGCWVADLRKPIWHETNEDGSLKTIFKFPERAIRGDDGSWIHQRESEDWCLSRELWERGCKDVWITSKVRLSHRGGLKWNNWEVFGKYKDGDEATAHKWRAEKDKLPLSLVQLLDFEIGKLCNLGPQHPECPNMSKDRWGTMGTPALLDDDTIVRCAVQAYNELGFTGLIGWHYYNEPLVYRTEMFRVMDRIREQVPKARFILWTNGMLIPEECDQFSQFEQIVVSCYNEQGREGVRRLKSKDIPCQAIDKPVFDERLTSIATNGQDTEPCLRPFVEFIVDAYGNTHLCCYDWQGKSTLGNVITGDFAEIAKRWRDSLPHIAGKEMTRCAPAVCQTCPHKQGSYQIHDERIVARAKRWREAVPGDIVDTIWDESGCAIGCIPKAVDL